MLEALKQFTKEGGVSEGEQPLEEYVQAGSATLTLTLALPLALALALTLT